VDFFTSEVIVNIIRFEGGDRMRKRWILALIAVAALTLFVGALQDVLAAERTMKIKIPGCV